MFYSNLRRIPSQSIVDISSIQHGSGRSTSSCHAHSKSAKYNQNQNRIESHQLCHSYSEDSLTREFFQGTKQTLDRLFVQTNFNGILDQIQHTLQPIVEQLRQQGDRRAHLSKQDRLHCMKSCAKFITETLRHVQRDSYSNSPELYRLQQVLDRFLAKPRRHVSVQTDEPLEIDLMRLHIADSRTAVLSKEKVSPPVQISSKPPRVSFASTEEHSSARQRDHHRSASRAFKQLHADLQKMNHETPFKSHLSKYHKHNH